MTPPTDAIWLELIIVIQQSVSLSHLIFSVCIIKENNILNHIISSNGVTTYVKSIQLIRPILDIMSRNTKINVEA